MASNQKTEVVRRISRGRSDLDSKAKTDSGCFVDELEKQGQTEKSPNANSTNPEGIENKTGTPQIPSLTNEQKKDPAVQNVITMENSGDSTGLQNDSVNSLEWESADDSLPPREDFYCLYYSDSPQGSLKRNKENSLSNGVTEPVGELDSSSCCVGNEATKTSSELRESVKVLSESSPESTNTDDASIAFVKRRPPPVAPKPKHKAKRQSDPFLYSNDPLLAEIEKLGASLGKDYAEMFSEAALAKKERRKSDSSLLQTAMRELNEANSTEECMDRLNVTQTSSSENLPDTLDRNKATINKPVARKKITTKDEKQQTRGRSSSSGNVDTRNPRKVSPKQGTSRKKSDTSKSSPKIAESKGLQGSSHMRSHMNVNSTYTPPSPKETSKTRRPSSPVKIDTKKDSHKKEAKPPLPKGPKPAIKKPEPCSSSAKESTPDQGTTVTKRSEFRSNRKRLSGDLSSIPEHEIMALGGGEGPTKGEMTSEPIPLAGEEDDDLLSGEEFNDVDDAPKNHNVDVAKTTEENVSRDQSKHSTPFINNVSKPKEKRNPTGDQESNINPAKPKSEQTVNVKETVDRSTTGKLQGDIVVRQNPHISSNISSSRPEAGLKSSVSVASSDAPISSWEDKPAEKQGDYLSEFSNYMDDETDGQVDLEQSDDYRLYGDPEELAKMTFGGQIDATPQRQYTVNTAGSGYPPTCRTQQHLYDDQLDTPDAISQRHHPEGVYQPHMHHKVNQVTRTPLYDDQVDMPDGTRQQQPVTTHGGGTPHPLHRKINQVARTPLYDDQVDMPDSTRQQQQPVTTHGSSHPLYPHRKVKRVTQPHFYDDQVDMPTYVDVDADTPLQYDSPPTNVRAFDYQSLKESQYESDPFGEVTPTYTRPPFSRSKATVRNAGFEYEDEETANHGTRDSSVLRGHEAQEEHPLYSYTPAVPSPIENKRPMNTLSNRNTREQVPDPSGFMTVEDIKRLLFKNTGVSQEQELPVQRPGSFAGIPSLPARTEPNVHEERSRRSWSGYEVQVQPKKPESLLVRTVPQNPPERIPKKVESSPYVRTVSQPSNDPHGYYSDSNLNVRNEVGERAIGRSQSFNGRQLPHRGNSIDGHYRDVRGVSNAARLEDPQRKAVHDIEERAIGRSQSFNDGQHALRGDSLDGHYRDDRGASNAVNLQDPQRTAAHLGRSQHLRRGNSVDSSWRNDRKFVPEMGHLQEQERQAVGLGRSHSFSGIQQPQRGNSLDRNNLQQTQEYQRFIRPLRPYEVTRKASGDSSTSEYSTTESEPSYYRGRVQNQGTRRASDGVGNALRISHANKNGHRRETDQRLRPLHDYLDSEEELYSQPRDYKAATNPNKPRSPQTNTGYLRHALRNASIERSISDDSDHFGEDLPCGMYTSDYRSSHIDKSKEFAKFLLQESDRPKKPTLSERFTDVPQRLSLEELAELEDDEEGLEEQLNLSVVQDGAPELEFDDGDYTDDKTMLVAEAIRVKKVLGKALTPDPALETLVAITTHPTNVPHVDPLGIPIEDSKLHLDDRNTAEDPYIVSSYGQDRFFQSQSPEMRNYSSGSSGDVEVPVFDVHSSEKYITSERSKNDSVTQMGTSNGKAISANELLELLVSASQSSVSQTKDSHPRLQPQDPHNAVQNMYFPAPQTKAASTGNIHAEKTFPGHVTQMYGNPDGHTVSQSRSGQQQQRRGPQYTTSHDCLENPRYRKPAQPTRETVQPTRERQYTKSHDSLRPRRYNTIDVVQARMISSSDNVGVKRSSSLPYRPGKIFEEEIDCMRTKDMPILHTGSSDFSASGSSLDEDGEKKGEGRVSSVSYIGQEETKEIETLPRVKLSAQRKRNKNRLAAYFLEKHMDKNGKYEGNKALEKVKETPRKSEEEKATKQSEVLHQEKVEKDRRKNSTDQAGNESSMQTNVEEDKTEVVKDNPTQNGSSNKSGEPKKRIGLKIRVKVKRDTSKSSASDSCYGTDTSSSDIDKPNKDTVNENTVFHNDNVPSPNSVNMFIDYKKKVRKVTSSTPKTDGKPELSLLQGISPVVHIPGNLIKGNDIPKIELMNGEKSPNLRPGSVGERTSSTYSSDDDRFGELFGSTDTVVFVGQSKDGDLGGNYSGNSSSVVATGIVDSKECKDKREMTEEEFNSRVDSILKVVKESMDVEEPDLLDQALERVKNRLSPGSREQAPGGLTMEAYVALHQADELQTIINEIKGELRLLQEENKVLRNQVNTLAHDQTGEVRSTAQTTEAARTESTNMEDAARRQNIADVSVTRGKGCQDDMITVDVFLRGFGKAAGLRNPKKVDVKLGTVLVKGGSDWSGVYDAAKTTFSDHLKRVDPYSYLGLSSSSMHGVETGATMWTPETLRRHTPRVEISRKHNSCIIHLKDGTYESCDSIVYDTLIPKVVVEDFLYQVLEHRYVILCGPVGLGKSYLASKVAENLAQRLNWRTSPSVITLTIGQTTRKELKKTLARLMKCDIYSPTEGVPAVIVLDQLNCLASLADIFDPSQLADNQNSPFIIGVRDKSKTGPFSAKDLAVYQYFRWIQTSVEEKHVVGLLDRFLRRKLSWSDNVHDEEQLMDLFVWLTEVWRHINRIIEEYCSVDLTLGPSIFYSCPMDIHSSEGWFANVWNYTVIPYLHQTIRNSSKIYERNILWDDPTKWVIMRWPWQRERSKVLPTLRKLRQVDIVLNRNQVESPKGKPSKKSRSKGSKLKVSSLKRGSHYIETAGSLESWTTADFQSDSSSSDTESNSPSTL